jgi:hypothetical protein
LAQELGVNRPCLYKLRTKFETVEPGEEASWPSAHSSSYRQEIHQLKRLLAEKAMEGDFLKVPCKKVAARRQPSSGAGEMPSSMRDNLRRTAPMGNAGKHHRVVPIQREDNLLAVQLGGSSSRLIRITD